jgi:intracellular multiplication protein IcmP
MQQNVHSSSSGGEDKLLAFGLILAVFAGGGWYLWYKYHAQIAAAVMAAQHWQMVQFSTFTDSYADLDRQVLATDPAGVRFAALFRLCRNVGSFLRWPAVALTGVLALLCLVRAAPGQFTRNLDLDGLMRTQAVMFRSVKPFVGRGLGLVPAADGKPRPADPALHLREWVARHATAPDGRFNYDAGRAELARQLGPVWNGAAQAAPHVRCLFAAFVLHAGRQREEAIALLGDMTESLPVNPGDGPAGPATPLQVGSRAVDRADDVLLDAELVAPCAALAGRHGHTAPALMSVLLHARAQAGVLAPGQFAYLKLVDRPLWYALHSLGFPSERGSAAPMPNPRIEALGSRDHWAAECALRRPLRVPALDAAMDTIRVRMKQAAPPTHRPQEAP